MPLENCGPTEESRAIVQSAINSVELEHESVMRNIVREERITSLGGEADSYEALAKAVSASAVPATQTLVLETASAVVGCRLAAKK